MSEKISHENLAVKETVLFLSENIQLKLSRESIQLKLSGENNQLKLSNSKEFGIY